MEIQLDFINQAFVELLSEDGLIILARGLGLDGLFLNFLKLYSDPHNLVLVLNTSATLEKHFVEALVGENVQHLPKSITNEYSAKEREALYLGGGVLFVTSQILVVDLLKSQCPADKVTGVLVFNAHRVTDSSTEAFILRLYRQDNKVGFIKAFSDAPEPFTNGFCQLERVMRNLFVKNVYLWPRFHATVSASLSRHKPDVIELRQQMTPSMTAIQIAVLDIMKACMSELKRYNSSLDTDEVTVENSMSKSFDQIIKLQLDPVWNQLGAKTKQLIFDLRMLRTLLYFLTQYDAVTFYSYLESVRSTNDSRALSSHSSWVFMDATNMLFVKARERVYGGLEAETKKESRKSRSKKEPIVIEESPKWHLLLMVLDEIRKECAANTEMEWQGRILIVVNDERTCYQLREFLCGGGQKLLLRQLDRLVTSKSQNVEVEKAKPQKRKLASSSSKEGESSEVQTKRRRKNEDAREKIPAPDEIVVTDIVNLEEATDSFIQDLERLEMVFDEGGGGLMKPVSEGTNFGVLPEPSVVLHAMNSSENPYHLAKVLRDLRPRYVIMYDAEIPFVRQVEVFKASNPGMPIRVYFLLYDSSVEEQKYLTALRKEKEAFHQLIKQRAHMVVPVDRDGKADDSTLLRRESTASLALEAISTRKAGGRALDQGTQMVLVDMREFRSTLPSLLHKRGIDINPLTLEVGDYILTPDVCVERKSVSDLIGSLNSGRLYNQATAMCRHYKRPILLIELDESKSFSLQSTSTIQGEISNQSVASKLVLLTLHFPNLRLLWCPGSYATAEVFKALKAGQPQPDAEVAAAIGQDTLNKVEGMTYSANAQDLLLKMPGINSKNYRLVMNKVKDFQELVSLSKVELTNILDNNSSAELLWNFLHKEMYLCSNSRKS